MILENIEAYAKKYGVPIMRPKTCKIIADFIKTSQPKHILEIGTAIGYSGTIMLKNCDGDLITMEHNKEYIKRAKTNFSLNKLKTRVKIWKGDCLVYAANLAANKKYQNYFDVIFLDGPKAQYDKLLDLLLILLKPSGTLIVDDVLFHGLVSNSDKKSRRFKTIATRMNKFIDDCKSNPKISNFELKEIEDGIIFATKG